MLVIGIDPGSASGAVAWLHAEGRAVGAIWATVSLAGLRLELVTPTEWKRWHRIGPEKEHARALAIRRFPALASDMARKKDADRAEALLIGAFGLHMLAATGAA